MKVHLSFAAIALALLTGCATTQTAGLSPNDESDARAAAHEFANAIRAGNASRLRNAVVVEPSMRQLGDEVIGDTVVSRMVLREFGTRFNDHTQPATLVASDRWLDTLESRLQFAPIKREAPGADGTPRMCLLVAESRIAGSNVHMRHVAGQWKVELISTMVPEAQGQSTVEDVAVPYRYGVTRVMKADLLARLTRGEFQSPADYEKARGAFWDDFLSALAKGKDPHDAVDPTLPVMPPENAVASEGNR